MLEDHTYRTTTTESSKAPQHNIDCTSFSDEFIFRASFGYQSPLIVVTFLSYINNATRMQPIVTVRHTMAQNKAIFDRFFAFAASWISCCKDCSSSITSSLSAVGVWGGM